MSTPKPGRVLVVDDEIELMIALVETLNRQGYAAIGRTTGDEALAALKAEAFEVLLTDLMMPGMDGIALLRAGLEVDPHLVGLIMTGQGTVQTAVEAMKTGAFDYVLKPFKTQMLFPALERALEVRRVRLENVQLRETVAIYELSQAIAVTLDLNTLLNKTAEAARQQMGADEVSILLHARDDPELYLAAVRGANREALLGQRVPVEGSIAGWVARHREPVILHGQVNDPRFAPLRSRSDIHSAISVPMLSAGHAVGVLNVSSLRPYRPFTPGQAKALSILANTAAAAVENAQLHAQVQASERRFRALIENSSDAITLLGTDGMVVYDSPAAPGMLGYGSDELIGQNAFELIHPEDLPQTTKLFRQLLEKPAIRIHHHFRIRHKNGSWRWVEAVASNLLGEPSVQAMVVNYRDVTERKQAEEALRQRELEFRSLAENIPDVVARFDRELRHIYINEVIEKITGMRAQSFIGKTNRDLDMPKEQVVLWDDSLRQVFESGQARTIEFDFPSRDGLRYFESQLVPELGPTGEVERVLSIAHDMTEHKRGQREIAQRLAELEAVNRISIALRAAQTLDEMLPLLLSETIAVLQVERGSIWLYEPRSDELRVAVQQGWGEAPVPPLKRGQGIPGHVFATGQAYLSPDFKSDPLTPDAMRARIPERVAGACIPIRTTADVIGTMFVQVQQPREMAADEVRLLTTLAEIAGNAIHRIGSYGTNIDKTLSLSSQQCQPLGRVGAFHSAGPRNGRLWEQQFWGVGHGEAFRLRPRLA